MVAPQKQYAAQTISLSRVKATCKVLMMDMEMKSVISNSPTDKLCFLTVLKNHGPVKVGGVS